jgi:pimeloyl-ACP methyl ester carboxylesterase
MNRSGKGISVAEEPEENLMRSKTIVFIHGLFFTSASWEPWIRRYEAKGYRCLAPEYPSRDHPVETLRKNHPDPVLGRLTLSEVVEGYANAIKALGEKPIIIGHSLGGLIVQLLLQRDMAVAGVAIDSAPPKGVFVPAWSFIRSNWPVINPFASKTEPLLMSFEHFQYAFVNTLPLAEQRAIYDTCVVPESRTAALGALSDVAKVDFARPRPPLLFIAGGNDHIIPPALNKANFDKYRGMPGVNVTDFKEFAGRTHYIIGQKGWEEVADYTLVWLTEKGV